ncbi:MAG: hypothetical protein ABIZ81_11940 [Opitutaceae bacterium]
MDFSRVRRPWLRDVAFGLIGLPLPLIAAQYSSVSPQELQRRLERDTNQLVDSLRNQRNSPSPRSSGGKSPWQLELEARADQRERENEARAKRAQLDAEWRRDHPNETRAQYFDRLENEAAVKVRDDARQRAAERARREAEASAERARNEAARIARETQEWEGRRTRAGGYLARTRPPSFPTTAAALTWFLAHDAAIPNSWAANQAAMLLIDRAANPSDLLKAARLVDPRAPRLATAGVLHPETRTLWAYLQLAHPELLKNNGIPTDPVAARAQLEQLATTNDFAKWYLARVLAASPAAADHARAFPLLLPGLRWMRENYAPFVTEAPGGRPAILSQFNDVVAAVLQKQGDQFPAGLARLSLSDFEFVASLLPVKPEAGNRLDVSFVEALAERVVPTTPARGFNYEDYDRVLANAADLGSDVPHGLAILDRFYLLTIDDDRNQSQRKWADSADRKKALAALTRWSARTDLLGSRSRLALEGMATEAASSVWWRPGAMAEALAWQASVRNRARADLQSTARETALAAAARRDASAPKPDAVPNLLAAIELGRVWQEELKQIEAFAGAAANAVPPAFAVTQASFELATAAARFDAACAPHLPDIARLHGWFEATRLGDAFAPLVLARELRWESFRTPGVYEKLLQLGQARRARDEAARNARALAARVIDSRMHGRELEPDLSAAIVAGSSLALRLKLARQVDAVMSRESDRPRSSGVAPELVAEFDAGVAKLLADPNPLAEWSLFQALLTDEEAKSTGFWFQPVVEWTQDREVRLGDLALIQAIRPEVDAIIATLALWPGMNYSDQRHEAWVNQAFEDFRSAEKLVKTDGVGALKLFLQAAGRGNRGALELLSMHLREGDGGLPRSPEFADRFMEAAIKIVQADAEVGDAFAADYLANCLLEGRNVAEDQGAGMAWLRYAAERGKSAAASQLAQIAGHGSEHPRDAVAARHWAAMEEISSSRELLPIPPRRLEGDVTSIAPQRAKLEAALATATKRLGEPKPKAMTEARETAEEERCEAAQERAKTDPVGGVVALAEMAGSGNRSATFAVAEILGGGRYGLEPDRPLAQRFHALGLAMLEAEAEANRDDRNLAHRLGLQHLELLEKRDPAAAVRWLSYSALRGNGTSAALLHALYTQGETGISPDPVAARRWLAVASALAREELLIAPPLKPAAPKLDLAKLRPKLEAALKKAGESAAAKSLTLTPEISIARADAIWSQMDTDPAGALLGLAELAAAGSSVGAFELAGYLSSGELGTAPDAVLAGKFHRVARALRQAEAERGSADAAEKLAQHWLHPVDAPPDPAAAVRWFTYAAELGNTGAAEELARLYGKGAAGVAPDAVAAARWTAFAATIGSDTFKPRNPLR